MGATLAQRLQSRPAPRTRGPEVALNALRVVCGHRDGRIDEARSVAHFLGGSLVGVQVDQMRIVCGSLKHQVTAGVVGTVVGSRHVRQTGHVHLVGVAEGCDIHGVTGAGEGPLGLRGHEGSTSALGTIDVDSTLVSMLPNVAVRHHQVTFYKGWSVQTEYVPP